MPCLIDALHEVKRGFREDVKWFNKIETALKMLEVNLDGMNVIDVAQKLMKSDKEFLFSNIERLDRNND